MTAEFNNVLIQSPVSWALCVTEEEFHSTLKAMDVDRHRWPEFFGSRVADATTHFFEKDGKTRAVVTIKNIPALRLEVIYALLAHEAMHIWQEIRTITGEKAPSSEYEAYAVQGICLDLFCWFRDKTKRRK